MRFVTAIVHRVENLVEASDFFCHTLGFYAQNKSTNYGVLLENGAVAVRLVDDADVLPTALNLELYSKQIDEDSAALLAIPGINLIAEQKRVHPTRLETYLQAPHGVTITLYQEFNEDELGIMPELPISLDWEQSAVDCIQQLLTYVPIDFRQLARHRVTERAEVLAAEQGEISVALEIAVQALAETTPHFQHPTLVAALQERGINPQNYFHLPAS
jgi:catechol-2,3-dioxygenase